MGLEGDCARTGIQILRIWSAPFPNRVGRYYCVQVDDVTSKQNGPSGFCPRAWPLIERLASVVPAFDDRANYPLQTHEPTAERHIEEVIFLKKAQLAIGDLYRRFRMFDRRFAFTDIDTLTVFVDNVLPWSALGDLEANNLETSSSPVVVCFAQREFSVLSRRC